MKTRELFNIYNIKKLPFYNGDKHQSLIIIIKQLYKIKMSINHTRTLNTRYFHQRTYTTSATSGAGTTYPSGEPEFTPVFSGVHVTRSLLLSVYFVDHCLSFCTFSFDHCVVGSYSIYSF